MTKNKLLAAALALAMGTALATGAASAQTAGIALEAATGGAVAELSSRLESGARIAAVSVGAEYARMSDYLIDEMILAFLSAGLSPANRAQLNLASRDLGFQTSQEISDSEAQAIGRHLGVQAVVTGAFEPLGFLYRFRARVIDVETAAFLGAYTAYVENDVLIAYLLGPFGRWPGQDAEQGIAQDGATDGGEQGAAGDAAQVCTLCGPQDCAACAAAQAGMWQGAWGAEHGAPIPRLHPQFVPLNWLSLETTINEGGVRYERSINRSVSIGVNAFWNWAALGSPLLGNNTQSSGAMATARFFPGGSPFYLELGLGYGWMSWATRHEYDGWGGETLHYFERHEATGLITAPGIGLRFGGRTTAIFANTFASLPVLFYGSGVRTQFRFGIGLGIAR